MNRILLGKSESGDYGLWVSKPGINVFSFAGNSYYDDAYGYNENFSWTGSNTYNHGWVGVGQDETKTSATSNGTILFNNNNTNGDPFFVHVMNTNPVSTGDGYAGYHRPHTVDTSFNGNTHPLLEFRVRRPIKSDGNHWQVADFDSRGVSTNIFEWFFATSNTTNDNHGVGVPATESTPFYYRRVRMQAAQWYTVMGTTGEWVTIEYDLANGTWQYERDGGVSDSGTLLGDYHEWVSNTAVHMLRLDAFNRATSGYYPIHTLDDPDLEVDYIRAKKRGVPINFGNSINENFHFSSDWAETGLVHASGRITLGNEYAWANGSSKADGTSHPGSTSGRVSFDQLPYIPVVLFQRYDPNSSAKASFPGGAKEFSVAHCDMTSDTKVWNPLTKSYQSSANTAYGSEYRTFAYARSGYDHFDLTCRNAIARDGFEHLFNYTPQEPYVEIYKGGNYDPETENPESFVMYPQQVQNVHTSGSTASLAGPRESREEAELLNPQAIDNGLFSYDFSVGETNIGRGEIGIDTQKSQVLLSNPPSTHPHSQPLVHKHKDQASYAISGRFPGDSGFSVDSTHGTEFYQNFGDTGVDGASHAVGKMKDGVLGIRRGRVITTDDLPSEGFDSSANGAGGDFKQYAYRRNAGSGNLEEAIYKLTGNPAADDKIKVLMNGGSVTGVAGDPDATFTAPDGKVKGPLGASVVNNTIYTAAGAIGSDQYTSSADQLDWSARDHADGKLGYFSKYTGTDAGNCLPTFDWANKFGDWNVPQFNNFYKYDPDIGAGSYATFKDSIGTTWTANNTRFLDDSMWLGYANNRHEYKGDLWHPQAPTKTYDELSGVFGFGGTIAHQGDWHDFAGTPISSDAHHGFVGTAEDIEKTISGWGEGQTSVHSQKTVDYKAFPGHGYTGIHMISRYDANLSFNSTFRTSTSGPFAVDIAFRNRYMYRPFNGVHAFSQHSAHTTSAEYEASLAADYQPDRGSSGPGTQVTYGRLHDHGRTGIYAYTNPTYAYIPFSGKTDFAGQYGPYYDSTELFGSDYLQSGVRKFIPSRWGFRSILPPSKYWADLSSSKRVQFDEPWLETDGITNTTTVEDLWTLGGHFDIDIPHDDEDVVKSRSGHLPSVTEQQTGQYGHKDSFVASRWYTYPGATFSYDISNFSGPAHYDAWYKNDVLKEPNDYKRKDYPQLYTGGWGNYGYFPTQEQLDVGKGATRLFSGSADYGGYFNAFSGSRPYETGINGPYTIFKKRARYGPYELGDATYDGGKAYAYFVPNHLHSDKQISRTFGIPNDIAGDYYAASKSHKERGDEYTEDPFHGPMKAWPFSAALHTRETSNTYYDSANVSSLTSSYIGALDSQRGGDPYPDYQLIDYLAKQGIDIGSLESGDAIPIQADPYFAGMAFYGTHPVTGAFNAHRFEFKIKKTKTHINHFRQSYEYNLPGRAGHRAETLRPIGYGLMTNVSGFDHNRGPAPAAHAYFDSRQLGGGYPLWRDVGVETGNTYPINTEYVSGSGPNVDSRLISISRSHHDGTIVDIRHPAYSNSYFSNKGWGDFRNEVKYDNDLFVDPSEFDFLLDVPEYSEPIKNKTTKSQGGIEIEKLLASFWTTYVDFSQYYAGPFPPDYEAPVYDVKELAYQSVSMSRHGRDSMPAGIIGAVEVANTYFADYKATYWDAGSSQLRYWITGTTAVPSAPTNNEYYNLERPLRYRPAKSQGASPETQMYGTYLGAPWNRHVDYHRAWAGLNSQYHSTGNHWEDDVLPGMCKADNALTNWGTVDLSKFDHNHIGYKWDDDAWHNNDASGLADSIVWSPSKSNQKWSDATSASNKGQGADPYGSGKTRRTQNQKGGTYDGFKLHERPEFQPVTGDGRYFGGVGGVDNWGGTSYNTWGPGMSVSPTVWDLKWTSIQHPYGVSPLESQDANTFHGATSIENQTSLIGGAPNVRVLIGDDGGIFKYSDGTSVAGTGYDEANTWSATDMNYDWAIGGHQIQSNHWDRTLKVKDLQRTDGSSGRVIQHANNGIQPTVSLKVKACYRQSASAFGAGAAPNLDADGDNAQVWILEDNLGIDTLTGTTTLLGWEAGDKIKLENAPAEWDLPDDGVEILNFTTGQYTEGVGFLSGRDSVFGPIRVITNAIKNKSGGFADDLTYLPPSHLESPAVGQEFIENNPQLVAHNQTLAEDPSRHPANAFKANTTYHFQYMYDETKINPPEYIYWVLRIPASMDSHNGESLI